MSTLAEDLINAVKNLQPRLCHRHAEKLIPPSEFKQIQSFWDNANNEERITVLRNFDSYNALELRRLFQLIARQELGVSTLISMRETQIRSKEVYSGEIKHILTEVLQNNLDSSLEIRRLTAESDENLIEKFRISDRVHKIRSEESLWRRMASDRRVFYFTHTQNPNQPLIVVNIALTRSISDNISDILDSRDIEDENNFNAAIFYSISAMETGLRGIDLGHRLIVSACDEMKEQSETAKLTQWSSLSPVPFFRKWCENTIETDPKRISDLIDDTNLEKFKLLVKDQKPELAEDFRDSLPNLLLEYLLNEKRPDGSTACAVENFHVRNGAVLWRVNFGANMAPYGMDQSLSMMVNYRYYPNDDMWVNALAYQENKTVAISDSISAGSAKPFSNLL